MSVINWLAQHWDDVLAVIGGVVTSVSIIVKLTATTKDNEVWAKVLKVLSYMSVVNPDGSVVGTKK